MSAKNYWLTKWDIIFIVTYALCITVTVIGYGFSLFNQDLLNSIIIAINIGFPLFLFLSYFLKLRHLGVFLIWLLIGILHLFVMYQFEKTGEFKMVNGQSTDGMLGILMALAAFLFAQIVSYFVFKQNFIAAAHFSPWDKERDKNVIDYVLTFVGLGLIALGFVIHHL